VSDSTVLGPPPERITVVGTCGVGDPACDLAIAWTVLTADGRRAFRERLSVDDATWARGRGWALWKTLATCADTRKSPAGARKNAQAHRALGAIFAEYRRRAEIESETGLPGR
jgi:aminoglycoside phosphotransferase (APT) family kinase protein